MTRMNLVYAGLLLSAAVSYAEPPATITPMQNLPPEVQDKMARLTAILAEAQQSGRLNDTQLQSAMTSGDAPALIRSLGPEAAQLLQDISAGLKETYSQEELNMILGGMIGAK